MPKRKRVTCLECGGTAQSDLARCPVCDSSVVVIGRELRGRERALVELTRAIQHMHLARAGLTRELPELDSAIEIAERDYDSMLAAERWPRK